MTVSSALSSSLGSGVEGLEDGCNGCRIAFSLLIFLEDSIAEGDLADGFKLSAFAAVEMRSIVTPSGLRAFHGPVGGRSGCISCLHSRAASHIFLIFVVFSFWHTYLVSLLPLQPVR